MPAEINVLIVDDHGIVRQGLRAYLDLIEDISIVGEAENGIDAIEKVKQFTPDIVLMDLVMPEMDGIEATHQIREWEEKNIVQSSKLKGKEIFDLSTYKKRVPIVALTASAIKGDMEKCLESGMDDYITKPINKKIFFEVIEKWISGKQSIQNSI